MKVIERGRGGVGREAEGARDGVRIAALLCIVGTCVSQAVDVQDFVSFRGVEECKERENGEYGRAEGEDGSFLKGKTGVVEFCMEVPSLAIAEPPLSSQGKEAA